MIFRRITVLVSDVYVDTQLPRMVISGRMKLAAVVQDDVTVIDFSGWGSSD